MFCFVAGGGAVQAEQPGEARPDAVLQDGRRGGHRHLCQPGRHSRFQAIKPGSKQPRGL